MAAQPHDSKNLPLMAGCRSYSGLPPQSSVITRVRVNPLLNKDSHAAVGTRRLPTQHEQTGTSNRDLSRALLLEDK